MSFWCQISQKSKEKGRNHYKNFIGILVDLKTPKEHFEINWPLVALAAVVAVKENIYFETNPFIVKKKS